MLYLCKGVLTKLKMNIMKKFYSLLVVLFAISSVAGAQNSENEKCSDLPRSRSRRTEVSVSPFMGSYMTFVNNHGALLDVRYKINSYVALGAGVGAFILDLEDLEADKAIYTSARVNLSKDTETVFLDFKLGGMATDGSVGGLWGTSVGYDFGKANIAYQYFYDYWEGSRGAISIGFYF